MSRIVILILFIFASNINAAENSAKMSIKNIESRESGAHDIYFYGTVPDQGCSLTDRGILDETLTGGKTMFSVLLAAFMADKQVVVRVDGCLAAPKIVKVQLYQ